VFVKDAGKIIQVGANVSGIRFIGMVSEISQGDHLPVDIQIIVHNGTSFAKMGKQKTIRIRRRTIKIFRYIVVEIKIP